jgi:hypothetical protein
MGGETAKPKYTGNKWEEKNKKGKIEGGRDLTRGKTGHPSKRERGIPPGWRKRRPNFSACT